MSLDDKIAAIMSGNFLVEKAPMGRANTMKLPGATDSGQGSPFMRSNVTSPQTMTPPISSPITSPLTRAKTVGMQSISASAPSSSIGSVRIPPVIHEPKPLPARIDSPLAGVGSDSTKSHSTLESMLSEYRAKKPGQSSEESSRATSPAPPAPSVPVISSPKASIPEGSRKGVGFAEAVVEVEAALQLSAEVDDELSDAGEHVEEEEDQMDIETDRDYVNVSTMDESLLFGSEGDEPEASAQLDFDEQEDSAEDVPIPPPAVEQHVPVASMPHTAQDMDKTLAWPTTAPSPVASADPLPPKPKVTPAVKTSKPPLANPREPSPPKASKPAVTNTRDPSPLKATRPPLGSTREPSPSKVSKPSTNIQASSPVKARPPVPAAQSVRPEKPAAASTRSASASTVAAPAVSKTPTAKINPPSTPERSMTPNKRSSAFYTPTAPNAVPSASKSSVLAVAPVAAPKPVKLAVRVRPFSDFEIAQKARRMIARGAADQELVVVNPNAFDADPDAVANAAKALDNKQWAQAFRFDCCLWDYDAASGTNHFVDQVGVHEALGLDIVDNVLNGVSCSCFAYGHTSTGKTYSLFGEAPGKSRAGAGITADSGLVPRVFRDIITAVKVNRVIQHGSRLFLSYLEIYNERVVDLLDDTVVDKSFNLKTSTVADSLKVREHPTYGPYVEGLKKIEVFSAEDVFELIAKCQKKRSSTQTAWNSHSSRSHAVVTLELTNADLGAASSTILDSAKKDPLKRALSSKAKDELDVPIAKVQMVDLAGSEKDSLREDEDASFGGYVEATPAKLSEADKEKNELKLIRRSLATLGFIIQSLAKGASFRSLPYRDSVLTFLLRDALNGFNHTTMLATISPAHIHFEETLSTLRYAEKLTLVRKKVNIDELPATLDSQSDLMEEFRSFHHDVKKGSLAARQMFEYTVTDPRQRIAKLTSSASSQQLIATPRKQQPAVHEITFTSPIDGNVKRLTELSGEDLEHLQSSYRNLQGQVVEMQIDLDAIKTDRDTLMVELRSAKDQQADAEKCRTVGEGKTLSAMKALKAAERELSEHRLLLKRKDENIERLLADLSEQKQARASAEQAYHMRTKEFLARFDTIKKENKAMEAALELANNRDGIFGTQKLDMMTQIDKLKTQNEQLHSALANLQEENNSLKVSNADMEQKLVVAADVRAKYDVLEVEHKDVCGAHEELRHEAAVLRSERDSLAAIVKQKDSLLWLQGQQSEMSIKMLQQRQATLDRTESHTISTEDWQRLSDSLKDLFTQEGQVLYTEFLDTKKLTHMVRDLREKMSLFDAAQQAMETERGARKELEKQLLGCVQSMRDQEQQRNDLARLVSSLQQELHEASKLGYTRRTLPTSLFQSVNNFMDDGAKQQQQQLFNQQCEQLRTEAASLQSQLDAARREAAAAKDDAHRAQHAAQKDLGSLWTALQELNKLDSLKDKSIQDLLNERSRLANERDVALSQAKAANEQCEELRRELEEIDQDLAKAATNNNSSNGRFGAPNPPSLASLSHNGRQFDEGYAYPSDNNGSRPGVFSPPFQNTAFHSGNNAATGYGNWQAPPSRGSQGFAQYSPLDQSQGGQQPANRGYQRQTLQVGDPRGQTQRDRQEPGALSEEVLVKQIDQLSGILHTDNRTRRSSTQLALGDQNTEAPPNRNTVGPNSNRAGSVGKTRSPSTSAPPPPLPSYDPARGSFSAGISSSNRPFAPSSATKRIR